MKGYKVLTTNSVLDIDTNNDLETSALFAEQCNLLQDGFYLVHLFADDKFCSERYFLCNSPIDIAGEVLAIKEGCDVVRWESGLPGIVGYYNSYENGFEVLPIPDFTYNNLLEISEEFLQAAFDHLSFAYYEK